MLQFFELLFTRPGYLPWIEVRAIAPKWFQTNVRIKRYFCRTPEEAVKKVETLTSLPQPYDIYFGVLPRSNKVSLKKDITKAGTLWVDIDLKEVETYERASQGINRASRFLGCDPAAVINSGHGLHGYWLLENISKDVSAIEYTNSIIGALSIGDKTHDCTRILRVPGTTNWKRECGDLCSLIEINRSYTTSLYSPGELPKEHVKASMVVKGQLPPLWQGYIKHGIHADRYGYYKKDGQPDRSRLDFAVVCQMLKAGYSNEDIIDTFLDSDNLISEKVLSKRPEDQLRYLELTISKARGER